MTSQTIAFVAVVALLVAAATAVLWPLRQAHRDRRDRRGRGAVGRGDAALRIARDSKLAELSDLDLDYRLGKLSAADYESLNATVRAEAVEILRELDGGKS